jgi:hypothetical protein
MQVESKIRRQVVLPARHRRLLLMAGVATLGGLTAYVFEPAISRAHGAPIIIPLAFLAGFSALWSP